MSASYPIQSPPTTENLQVTLGRLKYVWKTGNIRIEEYADPSGTAYRAFREDTGESILHANIVDLTDPEEVTREETVDHCWSLAGVIEALCREFGQPLIRTFPVELPADQGIPYDAFMKALKAAGVEAPFLADCEGRAGNAEA